MRSRTSRAKSDSHLRARPSQVEEDDSNSLKSEDNVIVSDEKTSSENVGVTLLAKARKISEHYEEVRAEWDACFWTCCLFNET